MFSFGHEQDLHNLLEHFADVAKDISITFSLSSEDDRFKALKQLIMTNGAIVRFDDDFDEEEHGDAKTSFYNEYFYVADQQTKCIALYCLFKLKLIAGRTLIICESVDEAYKVQTFLERSQIPKTKVYNPSWPLNVLQYFISIFNSGITNILVAPPEVFEHGRKTAKKKGGIKPCDNLIIMELSEMAD